MNIMSISLRCPRTILQNPIPDLHSPSPYPPAVLEFRTTTKPAFTCPAGRITNGLALEL